ncbi:MAG: tetratricopeptide repeat protein [Cyclobacteriaceae bacterium]
MTIPLALHAMINSSIHNLCIRRRSHLLAPFCLFLLIISTTAFSRPSDNTKNLSLVRQLRHQGDYSQSLNLSDSLVQLQTALPKNDYLAALHHNMGWCYLDLGIYDLALEHFLQCHLIYQGLENNLPLAISSNSIGNIYRLTGRYQLAHSYYQEAIALSSSLDDTVRLITALNNIGLVKLAQYQHEKAHSDFSASLNLAMRMSDSLKISIALLNLGENYRLQNQLDSAEYYYMKSLAIKEVLDQKTGLAILHNNLVEIYLTKNKLTKAESHLEAAQSISEEHGFLEQLAKNYQLWSSYYQHLGLYEQSLDAYREYDRYQDSLLNKEKTRAISEMRVRFETAQKEKALLESQERSKTQKALLEFQSIAIWSLICAVVLLAIAGFLLYRIYVINRRAKDEANLRMREQHHRIENNISVLASVLSLAAQNSVSEEARNVARDGENRLNAMNLLHKELYWDEACIVIRLDTYVINLVPHLYGLFKGPDLTAIKVETDEVEIDVNIAIPLSLILTELLMNAFKHGGHPQHPLWKVHLSKHQSHIKLSISDNGPDTVKHGVDQSFGLNLVHILTKQIRGTINAISNSDETKFELSVPIKSS